MAQRKETKTIQVRDLKPKKDAKGGMAFNQTIKHNPNRNQNQQQSRNITVAGG